MCIRDRFTADRQRGWAVGSDGIILATGDGGNAWTPQSSRILDNLAGVHVTADGQHGWAVGWNGKICLLYTSRCV